MGLPDWYHTQPAFRRVSILSDTKLLDGVDTQIVMDLQGNYEIDYIQIIATEQGGDPITLTDHVTLAIDGISAQTYTLNQISAMELSPDWEIYKEIKKTAAIFVLGIRRGFRCNERFTVTYGHITAVRTCTVSFYSIAWRL
jgi:hypothetical protein